LIKEGKIAEEGTHSSLMNRKGLYYDMFEVQSKYYREGGENHELQRDPA
jgi:ATP-binding cassette subfamily B protein